MNWKPEVMVGGKWCANNLCFATQAEAEQNAFDLLMRWTACESYRSVESSDPVNYSYHDHQLVAVPKQEETK
jgi:hypothetical protein